MAWMHLIVGVTAALAGLTAGALLATRAHRSATGTAVKAAVAAALRKAAAEPDSVVDVSYVKRYPFPAGMLARALTRCPRRTSPADLDAGLREFLIAAGHALEAGQGVGMPSKAVDEAWHEFMLFTKDYARFCERAFGVFLHHDPEVAMSRAGVVANQTMAMARTWDGACAASGLDPRTTEKSPALFRIDVESGVRGARAYVADCGVAGKCAVKKATVCVKHDLRREPQESPAAAPAAPSKSTGTARPATSPTRPHRPASSRPSYAADSGGWLAAAAAATSSACGSSSASSCGGGGGCGSSC